MVAIPVPPALVCRSEWALILQSYLHNPSGAYHNQAAGPIACRSLERHHPSLKIMQGFRGVGVRWSYTRAYKLLWHPILFSVSIRLT